MRVSASVPTRASEITPSDARLQTAHRIVPVPERRQRRLGVRQKDAACLGQSRATTQALEQGRAEFVLENAEATADRRLRAMQPLRRVREAAELGDGHEGLDISDIHRSVFLMRLAHTMHWTMIMVAAKIANMLEFSR